MQIKHESILRAINNSSKPYNILTFPTHSPYQYNWRKLPHQFYMMQVQGSIPWNFCRPIPENHVLLNGSPSQVRQDMKFDIVISQNKFVHYPIARQIAEHLNIPLITLEHTLPPPGWNSKMLNSTKTMRGNANVFISDHSVGSWGFSKDDKSVRVIRHGIDTETFKPNANAFRDSRILTVANDYAGRDWALGFSLYLRLTQGLPTNPVGDTKGLSVPTKSLEELLDKFSKAGVFLNTSLVSPVPMSLLEAMACECPIVSTNTCMIPEILKDKENAFVSNDEDYLRDRLIWCLENPVERIELGKKARQTIVERFSIDKHISDWDTLFHEVYGKGFNCDE